MSDSQCCNCNAIAFNLLREVVMGVPFYDYYCEVCEEWVECEEIYE